MGASSNFFTLLREGEEYFNLTTKENVYSYMLKNFEKESDFTLNHIKQKNGIHKEDPILKELYKEKRKITNKITEREQKLNHG